MGTPASAVHLSASLMCARLDALADEVDALEAAGIDAFHIDVMDGQFVANRALTLDNVAALRSWTSLPLEVHLMVTRPEQYLDALAAAGTDLVFFHIEVTDRPAWIAAAIRKHEIAPGIAVGPRGSLAALSDARDVRELLVLAVEPGFAGGSWLRHTPRRVAAVAKRFGTAARVHVDGHVDAQTAPLSRAAGATAFVCGTRGLFRGDPTGYRDRIAGLRLALELKADVMRSRPADHRTAAGPIRLVKGSVD